MIFLLYGQLCFSISWLFVAEIFAPSNADLYIWMLGGGVCFHGIGARQVARYDPNNNSRWRYVAANMLLLMVLILLCQFLFLQLYYWIGPHVHRIRILPHLLSFISNLLGLNSSALEGIIHVNNHVKIFSFSVTSEKLALFTLTNFFMGTIVLFQFIGRTIRFKQVMIITLIICCYALMRFVALLFIYLDFELQSIYWNPSLIFVSFAPLPILLHYLVDFKPELLGELPFKKADRRWLTFTSVLFGGVLTVLFAWGYKDPGVLKSGRILIDDAHSDWEWSDIKFDKTFYGEKSTYNYYSFRNLLSHYYDVQVNLGTNLNQSLLKNYDILILKTPTRPYLKTEKDAIIKFVTEGGGLFLIGDHNNLFGMSTYLNPVADAFKLRFLHDDTFDLTSGNPSVFRPNRLVRHPVVQHLHKFEFETSCTIEAPLLSEHVMIGYGLGSEMVDYSHVNFFGNMQADIDEDYGLFIQAAARRHGRGRVLAFSDSTVFSNFSMFYESTPELAISSIDYLNRRNNSDVLRRLIWALGLVGLLGALILSTRIDPKLVAISVIGGSSVAFLSAFTLTGYFNQKNYPLPKPRHDYISVSFDRQYSFFRLPPMLEYESIDSENCFDTFYVNTQRLNLFPSLENSLMSSFENGDVTVIINPAKAVAEKDLSAFYDYVSNGGRVLILDSYSNRQSTLNQFLARIDMHTLQKPDLDSNDQDSRPKTYADEVMILGGKRVPLTLDFSSEVDLLIYEKKIGQGKVVVLLGSEWLSRAYMGRVYLKPNARQLEFYNLQYYLFEKIVFEDI